MFPRTGSLTHCLISWSCSIFTVPCLTTAGIAQAIVAALLKKNVLPKEHAEKTLAALMAHHHHAQTKERHSMLEARAHRRMEQSIKNFRKANLQRLTR